MAERTREPRVVAELGRPETAEETAARKAKSSRLHRQRQTVNNLVYSLLATLGLVLVIVLIVPRGDQQVIRDLDYRALAAEAQPTLTEALAVPDLPSDWNANEAEVRTSADGVTSWYIGFVTPGPQFAGVSQGFDADAAWLAAELNDLPPTGEASVGGRDWAEYDYRDRGEGAGNAAYALSTALGDSTVVVYGTADPEQVRMLAESVAASLEGSAA